MLLALSESDTQFIWFSLMCFFVVLCVPEPIPFYAYLHSQVLFWVNFTFYVILSTRRENVANSKRGLVDWPKNADTDTDVYSFVHCRSRPWYFFLLFKHKIIDNTQYPCNGLCYVMIKFNVVELIKDANFIVHKQYNTTQHDVA